MLNRALLKTQLGRADSARSLFGAYMVLLSILVLMPITIDQAHRHVLPGVFVFAVILAVGFRFMAWCASCYATNYTLRKRGQLLGERRSSRLLLNQPIKKQSPLLFQSAWKGLEETLSNCVVKTPNMRSTVWRSLLIDKDKRQMQFELTYTPRGLGRRKNEVYPRTITLVVDLRNKGIRSEVILTYSAKSPMDYRTVRELIERTNATINGALAEDPNKLQIARNR